MELNSYISEQRTLIFKYYFDLDIKRKEKCQHPKLLLATSYGELGDFDLSFSLTFFSF